MRPRVRTPAAGALGDELPNSQVRAARRPWRRCGSTANTARAVALNDPVDGVALRLEHVVEAGFDQLPIPEVREGLITKDRRRRRSADA